VRRSEDHASILHLEGKYTVPSRILDSAGEVWVYRIQCTARTATK